MNYNTCSYLSGVLCRLTELVRVKYIAHRLAWRSIWQLSAFMWLFNMTRSRVRTGFESPTSSFAGILIYVPVDVLAVSCIALISGPCEKYTEGPDLADYI